MKWRVVLLVTLVVAVVLGAVGFAAAALGTGDRRFTPRHRQPEPQPPMNGKVPLRRNTAPLWWFAAGAVLVIGLASVPLLRQREAKG